MIIYDSDLKTFYSTLINDSSYISGFGTKDLGDARYVENIVNYFSGSYMSYKKIVVLEQIHSINISIFLPQMSDQLEKIDETDGVLTKEAETILTVKTGDCIPIIFVDKVNKIVGISHQGWRGSIKRMAQKMVSKMLEVGSLKKDIVVAIGPSIGECCYDIEEDRYYSFLEEFDGYSDKIFHRKGGKLHLNLPLLNYLLLIEAGIDKKNIDFFPFCTKCDKKRFFSFRRDKKQDYGEMVSYIMKR